MRAMVRTAAGLLAVALTGGCGFDVFQDVGTDPHPPRVTVLDVQAVSLAGGGGDTEAAAAQRGARVVTFDTGGLTIGRTQGVVVFIEWSDVGADMTKIVLRDRDLGAKVDLGPVAPDLDGDGEPDGNAPPFFPGTSGRLLAAFALPPFRPGPHRMELWAEDSLESRSEKTAFLVHTVD